MNNPTVRVLLPVRLKVRRGFTLIELLLVLVILATLAAIVVPKYTGYGEKARITSTVQQISNFKLVLDSFEVDCGRFPSTQEGLQALVQQPANVTGWKQGGYIESIPNDPWGHPYVYVCPGTNNVNGYDIHSCGPNGQDDGGGGDDIDNWTQK
jgi:general secretion pathway protein G